MPERKRQRQRRKGGTTVRPPDLPGARTTPIPAPRPPPLPVDPDDLEPGGEPAPEPPAEPLEDYVRDEDRGVIVQWHPGRPARGGSHTQIHTGEGYSFQITVFWNERGEIESFVIVNTNPGGPDISVRRRAGEAIEYIVKRENMIVVKTNKQIITYDGRRHAERTTRL